MKKYIKTLLLVEDKAQNAMMETVSLEKEGYKVIKAYNSKNALEIIRKETPPIDLILIDINLGKRLDGVYVAKKILKEHDIPLVFLTTNYDSEIIKKTEKITPYGCIVRGSANLLFTASIKMAFRLREAYLQKQEKIKELERINEELTSTVEELEATNQELQDSNAELEEAKRDLESLLAEHKQSEETLRRSEEKYRNILETMDEGLFESDLKGNYMFVNDAACRQLGYERDDLIGANYRKIVTPDGAHYLKKEYQRIYKTGEPAFLMDHEVLQKDGSTRIHQSNITLLLDRSGQPIGFRTLTRDVTERKKAEEKYRIILETMHEGFFECDLKGNYTFVNDAACKLMGYERDELIGMNYRKIHTSEMAKYVKEIYNRVYETGEAGLMIEYEVIRKDGSVRTHETNVSLTRDLSGKPTGFCILVRDVTERKKAEEEKSNLEQQLYQVQKMESIGRLAGGVAHDFNNMLTVIIGYAELIKSRRPGDDVFLRDIQEIENAASRSQDLTRQLLAFSRKEIIAPKPIDLNRLIVSTQQTLARLIGEDVDLRFYPGNELWKVNFDSSQMEHILINLSANARDAMPHGGKLTIETENIYLNEEYCSIHHGFLPGYYVMLGISDDGAGMKKETLQHVFEPFFTTKDIGKGTGLGLATVYGIVKQNDGFINVYSELGQGTTFKIYIPRSMKEPDLAEEPPKALPVSGTGTVLLVEDDDMVRQITTEMLEAIGYKTLQMRNPLEALSMFEKGNMDIDLVITDVIMPEMSGKELRNRLAAIQPGIKVLFMSGYTSDVIVHRGVLEEGVHFIQKPFNLNVLAQKVYEAINR